MKLIATFLRKGSNDIDSIVMDLKKKKQYVKFKDVELEMKRKKIQVDKKFLKNYLKENFSIIAGV